MTAPADKDAGEGGTAAPPSVHERNHAPDLTREYRNDQIAVRWYAKRCIHSAECIRRAPRVFDPRRRPWIVLDNADTQQVIDAVESCPTGALEYVSDHKTEQNTETQIAMVPNGPLFVRGDVKITNENGDVVRAATRVALCRCGKSQNMPFCDNSHRAR